MRAFFAFVAVLAMVLSVLARPVKIPVADGHVEQRAVGGRGEMVKLSNMERLKRGLPPKAPKVRWDATRVHKARAS